jgi:NitT/TauT family transport system permease protein
MIALGRALLGVALLAVWQHAYTVLGPQWVSAPTETAGRVLALTTGGELWRHASATLGAALAGLLLGGAAGIVVPFALRSRPRLGTALDPLFAAAMGVPKLALAPLLILWFGIGVASKVALVSGIVFFLLLFSTLAGVRSIDPRLGMAVRVLGGNEQFVTREVAWHAALPHVFAGLKLAVPRAISAAVIGEMIAADRGLGYYIGNAGAMADTVGVFAGVVLVTTLVMMLDAGLARVETRSMAWRPLARDVGI